jgi:hypothetical protein
MLGAYLTSPCLDPTQVLDVGFAGYYVWDAATREYRLVASAFRKKAGDIISVDLVR